MTRVITTNVRPSPNPLGDGDSVAVASGASVCDGGVMDGLGKGVIVIGLGVSVGVTGGVTRRSNFCSGRMTEVLFSPFQDIRSASEMSYQPAIHESVSPLLTV